MRSFASFALLSFAAVLPAQQVLWVDPVLGSNGNPGTYASPLQTIGIALSLAGPGAQVHLLPGTYGPATNGETFPRSLGSAPQQGLVLRGLGGPGDVVLDLAGSTATVFRVVNGADGCRITNLTITNTDRVNWWTRVVNSGSGVDTGNAASNVEIDRCRFVDVNRAIVLWTADNVQGWRVHDNLFEDCANDAILEYTGNNEVYNNTFVTGAYKGYISDSPTSLCYNNLFVGCAIAFENNNPANNLARYQDNWVWQCPVVAQGAGLAGGLPASNVVGVDPLLTNPAGGDYRPLATSPLRENGNPAIFARADLDGVARAVDSDLDGSVVPDIGCFEASPIALQSSWIVPGQLLSLTMNSAQPGAFGLVGFALADGVIGIPGEGPILLDAATFSPVILGGPLPGAWVLDFTPFAVPAGTSLFVHGVALLPSTPRFVGGNQLHVVF